jgi:transcriptional pleiotropic regulator of transition state genes
MTRKVDALGRIVLPAELRNSMGIGEKDGLVISVQDNDKIVLQKYENKRSCALTGRTDHLFEYMGQYVCLDAIKDLAKLAGII